MTYIYKHKDEAGTSSGRRPKDYVAGCDTRNIFRKKTKDYVTGCNTEIDQDRFIVLGRQKDTPTDWEVEI